MAAIHLLSISPARPTKGRPWRSSFSPGPSPIKKIRASTSPSPKTVCVLCWLNRQAEQLRTWPSSSSCSRRFFSSLPNTASPSAGFGRGATAGRGAGISLRGIDSILGDTGRGGAGRWTVEGRRLTRGTAGALDAVVRARRRGIATALNPKARSLRSQSFTRLSLRLPMAKVGTVPRHAHVSILQFVVANERRTGFMSARSGALDRAHKFFSSSECALDASAPGGTIAD